AGGRSWKIAARTPVRSAFANASAAVSGVLNDSCAAAGASAAKAKPLQRKASAASRRKPCQRMKGDIVFITTSVAIYGCRNAEDDCTCSPDLSQSRYVSHLGQ